MSPLRLIHTNDFHNALTESGAAQLNTAIRRPGAPLTLYLDAGDAVKAGNIGVSPMGEPILTRMHALGCAAMTLGNREFHISRPLFEKKLADARFPVLCANIRSKAPGGSVPTVPFVLLAVGGTKIAVFGLTVPMVTERMAARHVSDFLFDDPVCAAEQLVPELRKSADLVIALTHIGLKQDRRLAESVPGIDLIVGGHTHAELREPLLDCGTPILQAGSHARFYGEAELTCEPGGKLAVEGALHPLLLEKADL